MATIEPQRSPTGATVLVVGTFSLSQPGGELHEHLRRLYALIGREPPREGAERAG